MWRPSSMRTATRHSLWDRSSEFENLWQEEQGEGYLRPHDEYRRRQQDIEAKILIWASGLIFINEIIFDRA